MGASADMMTGNLDRRVGWSSRSWTQETPAGDCAGSSEMDGTNGDCEAGGLTAERARDQAQSRDPKSRESVGAMCRETAGQGTAGPLGTMDSAKPGGAKATAIWRTAAEPGGFGRREVMP